MSMYSLPSFAIPAYVTVATTNYSQLTNNATSALVSFYVLTSIFSTVFFDSLALLPCFNTYKMPGKNWAIYNDPLTISTQDPSTNQILSQIYPDSSVVPVSGSVAYNILGINSTLSSHTTSIAANTANIVTNTSNIATNTSNISSLQSSKTTDETNISTLQNQVATLQSQVASLGSLIVSFGLATSAGTPTVYTAVSGTKNVSQIATNQSNIATLTTDIGYLKTDINAMVPIENANSAAFNGLTTANLLTNSFTKMTNQSSISQF